MKKIVYIATREPAYSRVSIVRSALRDHFQVDEILSDRKSYAWRFLALALRIVWARMTGRLARADAVFVGFFAQPIFPLVRLLYRGPIVADAYFSLYDTLVHDKQRASASSLTGRLCYWLDRYMLRQADISFTDTEQHVDYFRGQFETPDADVRRLWISAESTPLDTRPAWPDRDQPFEVLFWGGFIPLQGVETIVRASALLVDENVRFTIVGNGQTFDHCVELQQELRADNVSFAGWQSFSEICRMARQSHIALGIFGTTDKAARVIPNKAFEALAMGIPLITRRSRATDELLVDGDTALLVDAGNPQDLADKIIQAREHPVQTQEIGQRGMQCFQATCSPQCVSQILAAEIESLWSADPQPVAQAGPPATGLDTGAVPEPGQARAGRMPVITDAAVPTPLASQSTHHGETT